MRRRGGGSDPGGDFGHLPPPRQGHLPHISSPLRSSDGDARPRRRLPPSPVPPFPASSGPVSAPREFSHVRELGHLPAPPPEARAPWGTAQGEARFHDNLLPAPGASHPPVPQRGDDPQHPPPLPSRVPPASRPPSGGYSLKPRRISLARSSVADMVLPRRAAGGRGWAGPGWLRGPGGKAAVTAAPQDPPPLPPHSLAPATGRRNQPGRPAATPPPGPRRWPIIHRLSPRARLPAEEGRRRWQIRRRVRQPAPPPYSRAAAQWSLRRPSRLGLTSPGDGSRCRTNLSRPLRAEPWIGTGRGRGSSCWQRPRRGEASRECHRGCEKQNQAWSTPALPGEQCLGRA